MLSLPGTIRRGRGGSHDLFWSWNLLRKHAAQTRTWPEAGSKTEQPRRHDNQEITSPTNMWRNGSHARIPADTRRGSGYERGVTEPYVQRGEPFVTILNPRANFNACEVVIECPPNWDMPEVTRGTGQEYI